MIKAQPFCSYCRRPVSDDLPPGAPLKATIDHIHPRAKGGQAVEANETVSCWECNRRKKARPFGGPDPNRSRDW
jgi:5-methylcytosine-specific restriction endonuclease McrA